MKYFIKNIQILILILLIISMINYYIDPAKKFINYNLEKDGNILMLQNLDERLLKKSFLKTDINKKDTVILGSSRVMTISLNDNKIINLGVSGANLKDDLALLHNYIIMNKDLPQKIILGIDPWIFNTTEDKRYKILEDDYLAMKKSISNTKIISRDEKLKYFDEIIYLLKISTLKDSLKIFTKNRIDRLKPYEITKNEIDDKGNIFLQLDRSLSYSKKYQEESSKNKERWKNHKNYQLLNFIQIDEEKKEELENFITWSKKNKIEVIIYLPPYNPLHFEKYIKYSSYEELFYKIEKYIRNIAEKNNILVLGKYYMPELSNDDFYDGIHIKREVLNEYLKQYLKYIE